MAGSNGVGLVVAVGGDTLQPTSLARDRIRDLGGPVPTARRRVRHSVR
jgi:hypothetical protein